LPHARRHAAPAPRSRRLMSAPLVNGMANSLRAAGRGGEKNYFLSGKWRACNHLPGNSGRRFSVRVILRRERVSKDDARVGHGASSFEGLASRGHLRMTDQHDRRFGTTSMIVRVVPGRRGSRRRARRARNPYRGQPKSLNAAWIPGSRATELALARVQHFKRASRASPTCVARPGMTDNCAVPGVAVHSCLSALVARCARQRGRASAGAARMIPRHSEDDGHQAVLDCGGACHRAAPGTIEDQRAARTAGLSKRARSWGASKSSSGPTGTIPVGLILRWLA